MIDGASMCTWEKKKGGEGECRPTEPPKDVIFLVIVAMLITIVGKVRRAPTAHGYTDILTH